MKCFVGCEQALISAWESDQRVKALKIAIQVSLVVVSPAPNPVISILMQVSSCMHGHLLLSL